MSDPALERARACLDGAPMPRPTRERLVASLERAWGPRGSLTPPRIAASVLPDVDDAEALVAIVGLFYTAVDLSDDVTDGDAEPAAQGDPERLLLWLPDLARDLDPDRGPRLLRALRLGGLAMWEGQDADLAARGRVIAPEQALAIADGKSGAEAAAVFAGLGEATGEPVEPWRSLGRDVGMALQLLSDLADFAQGARDWGARQPTWPLATALAHPIWGAALRHAWAGDHEGRASLGHGIARAAHDPSVVDALADRLQAGAEAVPTAKAVVTQLLQVLERWRSSPPAPEPPVDPTPQRAHDRALTAARAFLRRDPGLEETVERHERPMWRQDAVEAPLFGRLLTAWAARQAGVELDEAWALLAAHSDEQQRYFPTVAEVALDTDLAGWLLTAGLGGAGILERLEAAVPRDLPTWLGLAIGPDGRPMTPAVCIASMASASRGLHHAGSLHAEEAWDRTLRVRHALGPTSPYYGPHTVDALLVDAAVDCGLAASRIEPSRVALERSAGLSGLLGDPWATAVATPALLALEAHPTPVATHRALLDALRGDGGTPAHAAWRTLPLADGREGWYRSRRLGTAWLLRALEALPVPKIPVPATSSVEPDGGAAV